MTLLVVDFNQDEEVSTLTATDLKAINNRAKNFLTKALDNDFRLSLEEATPAFGLADLINATWETTVKVRIILMSNRLLSARVDGVPAGELDGVPITYNVWDLGRLQRYVGAGSENEEIDVDLLDDFPSPLPSLAANMAEAGYQGYLVVIPGQQLAQIYDRWSTRLLEQNVRVFLQGRGGVNRKIRATLENDPTMFFAYNNGLSATASAVDIMSGAGGNMITRIKNLQIVNGGQTTASIHAAMLRKVNLDHVFVQVKLSIVDPASATDVVPRISEYANSQNRISAADFFSNHPFHVRMEQFSRRIFAPSPDGTLRQSKWFYERARGQYQDARAVLTPAKRKEFDLEYPRTQLFLKTDLAKYSMVWDLVPHIVSRGSQKNFAAFAETISKRWDSNPDTFSELYYLQAIAKAVVWRCMESLIPKQDWYEGGYRANIVAYSLSKYAHDLAASRASFDFERIWREQSVPGELQENLIHAGEAILGVLSKPSGGRANVTEWAKHPDCWEAARKLNVQWPYNLASGQLTRREASDQVRTGVKDQRMLNGIAAQTAIVQAGGIFWQDVLRWGRERQVLSPKETGLLNVCCRIPSQIPTEGQSIAVMGVYDRLGSLGLPFALC